MKISTTVPSGGGCSFCLTAHQMWNRLTLSCFFSGVQWFMVCYCRHSQQLIWQDPICADLQDLGTWPVALKCRKCFFTDARESRLYVCVCDVCSWLRWSVLLYCVNRRLESSLNSSRLSEWCALDHILLNDGIISVTVHRLYFVCYWTVSAFILQFTGFTFICYSTE